MPVQSRPNHIDQSTAGTDAELVATVIDIDAAIEPPIAETLTALDGRSPLLAGMIRYHLGYANADFTQAPDDVRLLSRGKRLRPAIALLTCAAIGGDPLTAAPVGVAIELLHNFTLIHDDIQDKSETRRHRPTVWRTWGIAQAINAGDALFAASQLPLLGLTRRRVDAATIVELMDGFNRMTIEIVEGQVLDLSFEGRADISADDYLEMIAGKTAAIVRFAARSGAILGGANAETKDRFAEFGLALGLGYQIRDDALGVWGSASVTGKATADDIRRRKQSLPIVLLRQRVNQNERSRLRRIYEADPIGDGEVVEVLALLDRYEIAADVSAMVAGYHATALAALQGATFGIENPAVTALYDLAERLAVREA
jgi:geranylgeranyl diphosphate synthase type I